MNINLNPKQLLILYSHLKEFGDRVDFRDEEVLIEVRDILQDALLTPLEDMEEKSFVTAFGKWTETENKKIKELEEEIKHINETIPKDILVKKFQPVVKDKNTAKKKRTQKK